MLTLKDGPLFTFLVELDSGRTLLVQHDWEFPAIAELFGWQACPCGHTDGTIDCEHRTARAMLWDAYEFLDSHVGAVVEASFQP